MHTEHTINYLHVTSDVDIANCTQADVDGISWIAFHTGLKFIADYALRSFAILEMFFCRSFAILV